MREASTNTGLGDLDLDGLERVARAAEKVAPGRWQAEWLPYGENANGCDPAYLEGYEPSGDFLHSGGTIRLNDEHIAAFVEAANPTAVLKLIAAARSPQPAAPEGRMREALEAAERFFAELADADLDEIAADGGVTVGMVFQQQARTVFGPRARAALSAKPEGEA